MAETFLTPEGAEKIKAQLEDLTTTKRVELAARLRDAIKIAGLSDLLIVDRKHHVAAPSSTCSTA